MKMPISSTQNSNALMLTVTYIDKKGCLLENELL